MVASGLRFNPIMMGIDMWVNGFGKGDSWDGFFYNNAAASGSQLYPQGISKYYDVFSVDGLIGYTLGWIWNEIQHMFLPLTFYVPIDVWLGLFAGASLKDFWKILLFYEPFAGFTGELPSMVATFFRIEMEDGWGIMYN